MFLLYAKILLPILPSVFKKDLRPQNRLKLSTKHMLCALHADWRQLWKFKVLLKSSDPQSYEDMGPLMKTDLPQVLRNSRSF